MSFAGNVDVQAPFLQQHMEQDVAALRAHNQLAPEVSQHLNGEPQLTIGEIRAMQGVSDRVAQMWNDIREQTPCLSAAPNAPAPGLDRVQLSNPAQHQSVSRGMLGTSVGVQQQILDARAKLAAVNEKKKLAEQHLYKQQQLVQQTLQDKGDSDLKSYQRQIQEAEGHLQKVQQAMQNLSLGQSQPQQRLDHPQRRSVLRQVPLSSSHAQPAPPSRTVRQPEQAGFEIVVGADGRQYRVPRSQMSQVPEFEIVTGQDGRKYRVSRSHLSQPPFPQQQYVSSPSQQQFPHQYISPSPTQYPGVLYLPGQEPQAYPWQSRNIPAGHLQQQATPQGYDAARMNSQALTQADVLGGAGAQQGEQHGDRLRGIVNLADSEGARKTNKLIDYVRRCPAKWCKQVKPTSMNLPVFGYGAVSELVDSVSGRTEQLPESVLLAKLKHLRDVFEVCCINSSDTDFCDYGWVLARDYTLKVQDKVDQQQHSWETHTGIQSDVLISAQMEFPKPPKKDKPKSATDSDKPLCTTYNKCSTEGKCDYEVSTGRSCIRKHECSWCRRNKKQSNRHQESKCTIKPASGK